MKKNNRMEIFHKFEFFLEICTLQNMNLSNRRFDDEGVRKFYFEP